LTLRESQEDRLHRFIEGLVRIAELLRNPGFSLEVAALNAPVAEVARRDVHYRSAEIRTEGRGIPEVPESSDEPRECVLDEVFGEASVAGQQESEPNSFRSVSDIQVRELVAIEPGLLPMEPDMVLLVSSLTH